MSLEMLLELEQGTSGTKNPSVDTSECCSSNVGRAAIPTGPAPRKGTCALNATWASNSEMLRGHFASALANDWLSIALRERYTSHMSVY